MEIFVRYVGNNSFRINIYFRLILKKYTIFNLTNAEYVIKLIQVLIC